jgi:hypothetical protein
LLPSRDPAWRSGKAGEEARRRDDDEFRVAVGEEVELADAARFVPIGWSAANRWRLAGSD